MIIENNEVNKKTIKKGCILVAQHEKNLAHLLVVEPDVAIDSFHLLCLESGHVVNESTRQELNEIEKRLLYLNKYIGEKLPILKIYEPHEIKLILGGEE